ncbi:MAG: hypothetical protein R2771_09300 [Saprospiraceae bacterium]
MNYFIFNISLLMLVDAASNYSTDPPDPTDTTTIKRILFLIDMENR